SLSHTRPRLAVAPNDTPPRRISDQVTVDIGTACSTLLQASKGPSDAMAGLDDKSAKEQEVETVVCTACGSDHVTHFLCLKVQSKHGKLQTTIMECSLCDHRFLAITAEEQRRIEAHYDVHYAGFR